MKKIQTPSDINAGFIARKKRFYTKVVHPSVPKIRIMNELKRVDKLKTQKIKPPDFYLQPKNTIRQIKDEMKRQSGMQSRYREWWLNDPDSGRTARDKAYREEMEHAAKEFDNTERTKKAFEREKIRGLIHGGYEQRKEMKEGTWDRFADFHRSPIVNQLRNSKIKREPLPIIRKSDDPEISVKRKRARKEKIEQEETIERKIFDIDKFDPEEWKKSHPVVVDVHGDVVSGKKRGRPRVVNPAGRKYPQKPLAKKLPLNTPGLFQPKQILSEKPLRAMTIAMVSNTKHDKRRKAMRDMFKKGKHRQQDWRMPGPEIPDWLPDPEHKRAPFKWWRRRDDSKKYGNWGAFPARKLWGVGANLGPMGDVDKRPIFKIDIKLLDYYADLYKIGLDDKYLCEITREMVYLPVYQIMFNHINLHVPIDTGKLRANLETAISEDGGISSGIIFPFNITVETFTTPYAKLVNKMPISWVNHNISINTANMMADLIDIGHGYLYKEQTKRDKKRYRILGSRSGLELHDPEAEAHSIDKLIRKGVNESRKRIKKWRSFITRKIKTGYNSHRMMGFLTGTVFGTNDDQITIMQATKIFNRIFLVYQY